MVGVHFLIRVVLNGEGVLLLRRVIHLYFIHLFFIVRVRDIILVNIQDVTPFIFVKDNFVINVLVGRAFVYFGKEVIN